MRVASFGNGSVIVIEGATPQQVDAIQQIIGQKMPHAQNNKPKDNSKAIKVNIDDCLGIGTYDTRKGPSPVAIVRQDGDCYILAWIDEGDTTASHDSGGFRVPVTMSKLKNVQLFKAQAA